jgi:hypothetical protein
MKTKEEIQQLAEQDFKFWQDCGHYELADLKSIDYYYDGFTNGYTQCQEELGQKVGHNVQAEDMSDKKYSKEDVQNVLDGFTNEAPGSYIKTNFIDFLNKQD